jgi:multicomponent K+:H+ antiporter subunit F
VIEIAILIALHATGLAMLLALWRLVRGPTVPDRILALDTLNIDAILMLVLYGMHARSQMHFEAALILAMFGFTGTVVLTRYVLRRDIIE